jgi:UDP-N-acetylmuramoyl-L-alanyl-D-glutamate--2,6-diaminopimelate ligase
LERVRTQREDSHARGEPVVLVDYAHTPDALDNILAALRPTVPAGGRLVCVFGCGGDRDAKKRAPMGAAVGRGADLAILTTDNPRSEDPAVIASQAEQGLRDAHMPRVLSTDLDRAPRGYVVELDRRTAISLAVTFARESDVVVIAGKGHETYQEVNNVRFAFDDRTEARAALVTRAGGG